MADPLTTHPSDTDLLDFVESVGDAAAEQRIVAHLADCVICRIKVQRLRDASPIELAPLDVVFVPTFAPLEFENLGGEFARPGELWLTVASDAAMVLVRSVRLGGAGVVVVPVTADIEVADSSTRVLDEKASPVGIPIAIYDHLVVSLPSTALVGRIVTNKDVDLFTIADGNVGVWRGSALEGPSDPRLEVRQNLIDRLTALDPLLPEEEPGPEAPDLLADFVVSLRAGLAVHRGDWCVTEVLDVLRLSRLPMGWVPVALVSEFGLRVVIVSTPGGLNDSTDVRTAQALLLRLDASAVVVMNSFSDSVELYDPPTLFQGFEVPTGERTSYPLFAGMSAVDAIAKFLEQKSRSAFTFGRSGSRADSVDVEQVLAAKMTQSIAATVKNASRLGEEKQRGALRLEGLAPGLTEALKAALRPHFDLAAIIDIVDRGDT